MTNLFSKNAKFGGNSEGTVNYTSPNLDSSVAQALVSKLAFKKECKRASVSDEDEGEN